MVLRKRTPVLSFGIETICPPKPEPTNPLHEELPAARQPQERLARIGRILLKASYLYADSRLTTSREPEDTPFPADSEDH